MTLASSITPVVPVYEVDEEGVVDAVVTTSITRAVRHESPSGAEPVSPTAGAIGGALFFRRLARERVTRDFTKLRNIPSSELVKNLDPYPWFFARGFPQRVSLCKQVGAVSVAITITSAAVELSAIADGSCLSNKEQKTTHRASLVQKYMNRTGQRARRRWIMVGHALYEVLVTC